MSAADVPHTYELDGFRLEPARRLLTDRAGAPVPLTAKAFDALVHLVAHAGELVTRAALMKALWPKSVVEDNNLNQAIAALRRALGDRHVATVAGSGYQWVTPVRVTAAPVAEAVAPLARGAQPRAAARSRKRLRFALGAGLVAALAALGVFVAGQLARDAPADQSAAAALEPVLAILPFANQSPDPDAAFLADGIHTEISSALTNGLRGVRVISLTTMMSYRGTAKTLREIATELGATHVLEGAVRLDSDRVRVTLQLIDAATDSPLLSPSYEKPLRDVLALQVDIARMVAAELSAELADVAASEAQHTVDGDVYLLYLRAMNAAREGLSPTSPPELVAGIERMLDDVIAREPSFLPAYLQRIRLHLLKGTAGFETHTAATTALLEDLATARGLAPRDPAVTAAAAQVAYFGDDYTTALRLFGEAEAQGLKDSSMLSVKASVLVALGQWDEALALDRKLVVADPRNASLIAAWGVHSTWARKPADGIIAFELGTQLGSGDRWYQTIIAFLFGGDFGPVAEYYDNRYKTDADVRYATTSAYHSRAHFLRMAQRFTDLEAHTRRAPGPAIRTVGIGWGTMLPPGLTPTAHYRGWAALLNGNDAWAADEGRDVLAFVAGQDKTGRDAWYAVALAAAGQRFVGDRAAAIRLSQESVQMARAGAARVGAQVMAAQVLAWSGAHGDAIDFLEQLSTSIPGLPPAAITRDPIFTVPLGDDPRFRSLAAKLEGDMAATKLGN